MKTVEQYTDEELVEAIRRNQNLNKAISFIYQHHAEKISSFLTNYGAGKLQSEDIFQETVIAFIDIVKKDSFQLNVKTGALLAAIAKNIWFKEVKKNDRLLFREKKIENEQEQEDADVSQFIQEREMKQQMRSLFQQLDEPCQKILLLFYYNNLSMKEIVQQLHYENEDAVRNKKGKCLQYLSGLVKKHPLLAGGRK